MFLLFSFSFSFYVISSQVGHLAEFWFVMRGATSQMERKEVQEMTRKLVETIAANDIDQRQTQMPDITGNYYNEMTFHINSLIYFCP